MPNHAVQLDVIDPEHPHAQFCLREYYAELDRRFHTGFDPTHTRPTEPETMRLPVGLFVVATLGGEPVGCGALRFHADEPTELKRMWVAPSARGLGVGRRLLADLERRAAEHGSHVIQLDTNATLVEAIAMYRSSGYVEVEAFNDEPYADHWFEKALADAP